MSYQRRSLITDNRFNRILRIANLDPLVYGYEDELERGYGRYLDDRVKLDFMTQVSMLANERLMTHDLRVRQGKVWGQTFNLVVGQPIRIDLIDPHKSTGYAGLITLAMRTAVFLVKIVNKGAGDLLYSLNVDDNGSVLLPKDAQPAIHEATIERYEVINLQAVGSNAQVNVAVEV